LDTKVTVNNNTDNYDVKVGREKVVVLDRNLVEVIKCDVHAIIDKDELQDWMTCGWQTKDQLIGDAEKAMEALKKKINSKKKKKKKGKSLYAI